MLYFLSLSIEYGLATVYNYIISLFIELFSSLNQSSANIQSIIIVAALASLGLTQALSKSNHAQLITSKTKQLMVIARSSLHWAIKPDQVREFFLLSRSELHNCGDLSWANFLWMVWSEAIQRYATYLVAFLLRFYAQMICNHNGW